MAQSSTIAENRRARFEYTLDRPMEAGLVLQGWEVKSLRAGHAQITDSHVILRNGEAFLLGSRIHPLSSASTHLHPDPTRTRKLLLHGSELHQLTVAVERKGYTVIPTRLYWHKQHIKLAVALAKGKKLHDKRHAIQAREWKRDQARLRVHRSRTLQQD